ncbi:MAG: hypothetical protein OEW00_06785 [candidate division Zixibacteria bacterium]|nr:hypothetical protein [candidate division Zixibacteria bacterium]
MKKFLFLPVSLACLVLLMQLVSCGGKEKESKPASEIPQTVREGVTTWERVYEKDGSRTFGMAVEVLPDSRYLVAGSQMPLEGKEAVYLLLIDSLGDVVWEKTYGKDIAIWATDVVPAWDGGYLLCCQTNPDENNQRKVYLMKVDSLGGYQWDRVLKSGGDDLGAAIAVTTDSNYVIVGNTSSISDGATGAILIKVDQSGSIIWKKAYFDIGARGAAAVLAESDGGYVMTASVIATEPSANDDVMIFKTDPEGNVLWYKTFGGEKSESAFSLIPTADGGYALAGTVKSMGPTGDDFYIAKVDADGDLKWDKAYGGGMTDMVFSLAPAANNGLVAAGLSRSFGDGILKVYMGKVDKEGDLLWEKVFHMGDNQHGRSIALCPDGGYVIAAGARKSRSSVWMAYVLKTDENGNIKVPDIVTDTLQ